MTDDDETHESGRDFDEKTSEADHQHPEGGHGEAVEEELWQQIEQNHEPSSVLLESPETN